MSAAWALLACVVLASTAGSAAQVTSVPLGTTFAPQVTSATAAAQFAAAQAAAAATSVGNQVAGQMNAAYANMARKAELAYTKKQDAVMGLLYVDLSTNLGDPLALCNDGSQGAPLLRKLSRAPREPGPMISPPEAPPSQLVMASSCQGE